MIRTNSPIKLWDHCVELQAFIRSHTCTSNYELDGEAPETYVTGQTADISQFCEHQWHDWVMFYDTAAVYPDAKPTLGRWLGPSLDVGPAMSAKILKANEHKPSVVHRHSYRPLTQAEQHDPAVHKLKQDFDDQMKRCLGKAIDPRAPTGQDPDVITPEFDLYEDDETEPQAHPADFVTPETSADNYLGAQVNLPHSSSGTNQSATVKKRARQPSGDLKGTANPNPILDTRVHEVESVRQHHCPEHALTV